MAIFSGSFLSRGFFIGRFRFVAARSRFFHLVGIVGDIPAGPLEHDSGGGDDLPDAPFAFGAFRDWRIAEFLDELKLMLAFLTDVLVDRQN